MSTFYYHCYFWQNLAWWLLMYAFYVWNIMYAFYVCNCSVQNVSSLPKTLRNWQLKMKFQLRMLTVQSTCVHLAVQLNVRAAITTVQWTVAQFAVTTVVSATKWQLKMNCQLQMLKFLVQTLTVTSPRAYLVVQLNFQAAISMIQ